MATSLTPFQTQLDGAVWIDVNTLVSQNSLPDRLPDESSIMYGSLFNLLNCPIGARSRTFQPTYGCLLYQILQEPIDENTRSLIQLAFIQAIEKWEPRIELDYSQTSVEVDYGIPGYRVRIAYTIVLTQERGTQDFVLSQ